MTEGMPNRQTASRDEKSTSSSSPFGSSLAMSWYSIPSAPGAVLVARLILTEISFEGGELRAESSS